MPPAVALVAAASITPASIVLKLFISFKHLLRKSGAKVYLLFKYLLFAHTKLTKFNDVCTKTCTNVQFCAGFAHQ
jgi:hypothetical protein